MRWTPCRPWSPPGEPSALAERERTREEFYWEVLGGGMAGSADLGYSRGRGTLRAGPDGPPVPVGYARIWRRHPDGPCRFVVEVVLAGG